MMKQQSNSVSQTVLYSVLVIVSLIILIWLFFSEKVKAFISTEFLKTVSNKDYISSLLIDLSKDSTSIFGKKS